MRGGGSYNRLHSSSYNPSSYFSSSAASNYYTPHAMSSSSSSPHSAGGGTAVVGAQRSRVLQYTLTLLLLSIVVLTIFYRSSSSSSSGGVAVSPSDPFTAPATAPPSGNQKKKKKKQLQLATWNIAAINNNPFEYWITAEDPQYNALLSNVSQWVVSPPVGVDVPVKSLFSDAMLDELIELLQDARLIARSATTAATTTATSKELRGASPSLSLSSSASVSPSLSTADELRTYFTTHYASRRIVSEFLKDGALGKKRLVSMPDRVTNTVRCADNRVALRPTAINCFSSADLATLPAWWKEWKFFIFQEEILAKKRSKSGGASAASAAAAAAPPVAPQKSKIYKLVQRIDRAKYPSLSVEEEKMSIPLSLLSLAVFDAILVHMMNSLSLSLSIDWQRMRATMCTSLNQQKNARVLQILETTYARSDVLFLQEVAGDFLAQTRDKAIANLFDIHQSALMDMERDQNSFVLLRKGLFRDVVEVTGEVNAILAQHAARNKSKLPVVAGDLIVLLAAHAVDKTKYIFASFHGDTNGLATKPVLTAVHEYATTHQPASKLLFGMDANTYAKPEADQQGVEDFANFYRSKRLNSCYGPHPNPLNFTTFHARTHLQPQLNKAISLEEKDVKGDKNPKDFIVFFDADFKVLSTTKDNTGQKKYIENMVFPTLSFPSDHGITSTVLEELPV